MRSLLEKGRFWIVPAVLLGMAVLIWWAQWSGRVSEQVRSNPGLVEDLRVLRSEDRETPEARVVLALLRLSSALSREGRREALARWKDPRPAVRRAVAESLALYDTDPEVSGIEERMLRDGDPSVRFAMVRALAFSTDPGRERLLQQKASDPSASPAERIAAEAGLSRTGLAENAREHLRTFRTALEQSEGTPHFAESLRILTRLLPEDPACIRWGERMFLSGRTPPELLPDLYLFLSRRSPAFVSQRVLTDIRTPILPLRNAVINSLATICPPDRWKALQWVLEEGSSPEPVRQLAWQVARQLGLPPGAGSIPRSPPPQDRCNSRR